MILGIWWVEIVCCGSQVVYRGYEAEVEHLLILSVYERQMSSVTSPQFFATVQVSSFPLRFPSRSVFISQISSSQKYAKHSTSGSRSIGGTLGSHESASQVTDVLAQKESPNESIIAPLVIISNAGQIRSRQSVNSSTIMSLHDSIVSVKSVSANMPMTTLQEHSQV
jgi:hypothetical protein